MIKAMEYNGQLSLSRRCLWRPSQIKNLHSAFYKRKNYFAYKRNIEIVAHANFVEYTYKIK